MKYKFNDYKDDTHQNYYFEYHEVMPKTKRNYNFNVNALIYYGLYRNAVYSAYRQNKNVASDILNAPLNAYDEKSQSLKQKRSINHPFIIMRLKHQKQRWKNG